VTVRQLVMYAIST